MIDIVLTAEDPEVPEDCIPNAIVRVVQYIKPDGQIGLGVRTQSQVPMSQVIGLLGMAAIYVYQSSAPGEIREGP